MKSNEPDDRLSLSGEAVVIRQLEQAIKGGKHWYPALLEAIGSWQTTEENFDGRHYKYLIAVEAFDWLLLAERLSQSVKDLIPEDERLALLFHGEPPLNIPIEKFKELIGEIKYHQHLNFFYGVTVEESLAIAIEEEVRKERWISGLHRDRDNSNEAYRRIYGATKTVLLRQFRHEIGYLQLKSISLSELKEFNYWLFKLRLKQSDKAKVASDTRKALDWLKINVFSKSLNKRSFGIDSVEIDINLTPGPFP